MGVEIGGRYNPSDDVQAVQVKNIYGKLADVDVAGSGWYVSQRPPEQGGIPKPPLSLLLTLTREGTIPAPPTPGGREVVLAQQALAGRSPAEQQDAAAAGEPDAQADAEQQAEVQAVAPIRGMISTWLYVDGDPLLPLFNAKGSLITDSLAIGPYELGSLNSAVEATLTGDRLLVRTPKEAQEKASLLGAQIVLAGDVPFDERDPGRVHFEVANLDLGQAATAAAIPLQPSGQLDGELDVFLRGLSLEKLRGQGEFVVSRLALPQAYLADSLTIRPNFNDGVLSVPIELDESFADVPGPTFFGTSHKLALQALYDLSRPGVVEVLNLRGEEYPIAVAPGTFGVDVYSVAKLSARAPSLTINLNGEFPTLSGRLVGRAQVLTGGKPFALSPLLHGEVEALATQSRVTLEKLSADLPGLGDVTGGGSLSLEDLPGRSRLYVHGRKLDLAAIGKRLKLPEGAGGFVDFSLVLQPAPGRRPKGEVLVNFGFEGDNARWRTVQVGSGQVVAYLSRTDRPNGTKSNGQFDFTVATTERVHFQVADGDVEVFAKLRDRGDGVLFVQSSVAVTGMQLAQLGPLADKPDLQGVVGLDANVFGNLTPTPRFPGEELPKIPVDGQVSLTVREGKIANLSLFKVILDRLKFIPQRSADTVDVRLRLERDNVQLAEARAVVSGAELRASGDIKDVAAVDKAQLNLSVLALLRPLGSFKIPFSSTVDDLLAAIQSQATALEVTGTIAEPKAVPKSLNEVGSTLKALLGGKSQAPAE